ncbi:MAG: putative membrane protein YkoI [Paraglaciecola psychrophila]|jgi:uncharacterized membrane protein YkoI
MVKSLLLLSSLLLALGNAALVEAAQNDRNDVNQAAPTQQTTTQKTTVKLSATPPREGESIWLEKKLAPSTRWIERLITPLNRWMEQKVQAVKPAAGKALAAAIKPLRADGDSTLLSKQQISAIAQQHAPGKVLAVKLLPPAQPPQRYRVKLLSPEGVIRLLYFNAKSGTVLDNSLSGGR